MSFEIITAMITPFDEENNINYEELKRLIDLQLSNNIDGLVVAGSTGGEERSIRRR